MSDWVLLVFHKKNATAIVQTFSVFNFEVNDTISYMRKIYYKMHAHKGTLQVQICYFTLQPS